MIYIQLSLPYRDFDKVFIKSFYFYDNSISVIYCVKNNQNTLFEKTFNITAVMSEYQSFFTSIPNSNFTIIDNIHMLMLKYIIEKNIETGTLEVK